MPTSLAATKTRRKGAGAPRVRAAPVPGAPPFDPVALCAARHPWAADDLAHVRRWALGDALHFPPELVALIQAHHAEQLAAHSEAWRPEANQPYADDRARVLAAVLELVEQLEHAAAFVALDASDAAVCEAARRNAELLRMASELLPGELIAATRARLMAGCARLGVPGPCDIPDSRYVPHAPAIARMVDRLWWTRQLRRAHGRALETGLRGLGAIGQSTGELYCSNAALRRRLQQLARNHANAEATVMESAAGVRCTRAQAIAATVSNPRLRRAELMLRINGLERWAKAQGHVGAFATITAPSRMHVRTTVGGVDRKNPAFDSRWSSAATVHRDYLVPLWQCMRAQFDRDGLEVYGFRVVEPHADGTPHWHLLLFCPALQLEQLRQVMQTYALADSPGEPGARAHRFSWTVMDEARGGATAYMSKYLIKWTDGGDRPDLAEEATRDRVQCWAALWGIRQFATFGAPPVTVYRELRRVPLEVNGRPNPDLADVPQCLRDALLAVNRWQQVDAETGEVVTTPADFAEYVEANGGTGRRRYRPLRLVYERSPRRTRYGELYRRTVGVLADGPKLGFNAAGELVLTPAACAVSSGRIEWRVVGYSHSSRLAQQAERTARRPRPWTRDNNCTAAPDGSSAQAATNSSGSERGPPPAVPVDRLDKELDAAWAAARDSLVLSWYWPRSGVPTRRPLTDDERDLAADLARSRARYGELG